jgi:hypothetical protein
MVNGETSRLVANARFQVSWSMGKHFIWWPMEGSKLGGLWDEKEKHPFHFLPFFTPYDFT